jgi:hypothetical protein
MGNFWGGFGQGFGPAFTGAWARASEKAERAAERKAELERLAQLAQEERIAKALAYEEAGADVRSLPLVKDQLKGPWSRENMLEQQPGVPFVEAAGGGIPTGDQAIGPLEEGAGPLAEGFERQAGIPAGGAFAGRVGMPERPTGAALESLSRPELIATALASELKYAKGLKEEEREYGKELQKAKLEREAQLREEGRRYTEAQKQEGRIYTEKQKRHERLLEQAEDAGREGGPLPVVPDGYTSDQAKEVSDYFAAGARQREAGLEKLAFDTAVAGLPDMAKNASLTGGKISLPQGVSANYEQAWGIAADSAMAAVKNPELQKGKDKAAMVKHLTDFAKESGVGDRLSIVTGIDSVETADHAKVIYTEIARTAEYERTIENMMELGDYFGSDITGIIKKIGVSSMPLAMMERFVASVDLVPSTTADEKNVQWIERLVKHLNEQELGSDDHKDAKRKLENVLAIVSGGYELSLTFDEAGEAQLSKKKTARTGPPLVEWRIEPNPFDSTKPTAIVYPNPYWVGRLSPEEKEEQTKLVDATQKVLKKAQVLSVGTGIGPTNDAGGLEDIVKNRAQQRDYLNNVVTIDALLNLAVGDDDDAKDELLRLLLEDAAIVKAKSFDDLPPKAREPLKDLADISGITIDQFRKAIERRQD